MLRNIIVVTVGILLFIVLCVRGTAQPRIQEQTSNFKGPVGLQLYSLRKEFSQDVTNALAEAQGFGIRDVELSGNYGLAPETFKQLLEAHKLNAIAGQFPYERFRDDPDGVASEANKLGLRYACCAWIPHIGDFNEKDCRLAIQTFNTAGAVLAKHGVQICYHTHGFEFQPYGSGTLFDLLVSETNPKAVLLEMDVMWVYFAGQDPVKLINKYGGRWRLMHLKDLKKGVTVGALTGQTDVANDVVLGTGQIDWPPLLLAAKQAGIELYYIEDESPSAATQIPQSIKYLEKLKL